MDVDASELEPVRTLLVGAGYHDVRLTWERATGSAVLLAGEGGSETLEGPWGGGRLVLESPLLDPVLAALFALLRRDLRPPQEERRARQGASKSHGGIVGQSPGLVQVLDRLDRLAASDLPVLVLGESGTGKELAAKRVHALSPRSQKAFLPINCAELAETLIQSDLFGTVRGAYTGADRDRVGIFESARGGTVFLDEIGDLPASAQGKLLRVLQEGEVRRLGESVARKVDVRVVAATHRDLAAMVDEGAFRQDLYFRLKVATVELPPLRERGRDILEIAEHHLETKRRLQPGLRLTTEAEALLLGHPWPGNVRELINVLDLGATLASDGKLGPEVLELGAPTPAKNEVLGDYHQKVEDFRKDLLVAAIETIGQQPGRSGSPFGSYTPGFVLPGSEISPALELQNDRFPTKLGFSSENDDGQRFFYLCALDKRKPLGWNTFSGWVLCKSFFEEPLFERAITKNGLAMTRATKATEQRPPKQPGRGRRPVTKTTHGTRRHRPTFKRSSSWSRSAREWG